MRNREANFLAPERAIKAWGVACLLVAATTVAAGAWASQRWAELKRQQERVWDAEAAAKSAAASRREEATAARVTAQAREPWSIKRLDVLAMAAEDALATTSVRIDAAKGSFEVIGVSDSYEDALRFEKRLQNSPLMVDVKLKSAEMSEEKGKVWYRVSAGGLWANSARQTGR